MYAVRSTRDLLPAVVSQPAPRRDRAARARRRMLNAAVFARASGARPRDITASDPWVEKIRRACVYLANVEGHPSLAALAARLGGSPYHLQRNFKRLVGLTPRQYAEACRLGKVKRRLRGGDGVTAAMLDAGYGSSSRFYERAVPKLGMAPSVYRRGGAGMSIRYTIVDSANASLGRLLVAATSRGVCAVAMGASDAELQRNLDARVPGRGHQPRPGRWPADQGDSGAAVGPSAATRSAARRAGDGVSVAGVAGAGGDSVRRDADVRRDRLGHQSAARVARRGPRVRHQSGGGRQLRHRVVAASGAISGYRWGVARKRALLARERPTTFPIWLT